MADILFVCVRKDLARADTLADMFQAAGFSVGDLPESEDELRAAGAALLVWSEAARDSAPFHEAAARVMAAERAVFATLDASPRPADLGATPFFDLSGWRGDPDDSVLDPLFAAIDKVAAERRAELERWGAAGGFSEAPAIAEGPHGAVVHEAEPGAFAFAEPDSALRRQGRRGAPSRNQASAPGGQAEGARSAKRSTGNRRRRTASVGQMLIPVLASASIAVAAYFGGLAESKNAPDTLHAVRVAIPPAASANLVRLRAPAIETASPTPVQELQAPLPRTPRAAAADQAASVAPAEPPRPRLRVRAPSPRLRALTPPSDPSLQMAALTAPQFIELEPVVFTRRGRTMRIRAERETLDSDARTASVRLLQGAGIESAALVARD